MTPYDMLENYYQKTIEKIIYQKWKMKTILSQSTKLYVNVIIDYASYNEKYIYN